jgi:hypothetical protein
MTTFANNRTPSDLVADFTTDGAARALSPTQADRYTIEIAIARMNPDPAKVRATIDTLAAKAATAAYWPLVVNTLATTVNTIHLVHAAECRLTGCRTCAAISLAVTTVAAHFTVTGGDAR